MGAELDARAIRKTWTERSNAPIPEVKGDFAGKELEVTHRELKVERQGSAWKVGQLEGDVKLAEGSEGEARRKV